PLDVRIVRQTDARLDETPRTPVWEDRSGIAFSVQDTSVLEPGQFFIHQFRVLLTPGEYELIVAVPDSGSQTIEARRDLAVPDFAVDRPTVSDVTLASDLHQSSDRSSPFFKNGLEIRPNANRLFGVGLDRLFYYAE